MSLLKLLSIITILLTLPIIAGAEDMKVGTISGKWQPGADQPMVNGQVLLFNELSGPPPLPEMYWRVPDYIATIDSGGKFSVKAIPGNYYLGTIMRQKGNDMGPLLPGDSYFLSKDKQGSARSYNVKAGEDKDVGTLVGSTKYTGIAQSGATAIEGTVLDESGKPVEGVLVFAFINKELQGRPIFIAPRTGKDGKFRLGLSGGGTYYLKIRDIYGGGQPQTGQIMGFYGDGKSAMPVNVKSGTITKDINIKATRFAGRGNPDAN